MSLPFSKYQGTENSFVILSRRDTVGVDDIAGLARKLCSPSIGIGSDGLLVVDDVAETTTVDMFNPDGSLMGMCGNGIRCVYRYIMDVHDADHQLPATLQFSVEGRTIVCSSQDRGVSVQVDMGRPAVRPDEVPFVAESEQLVYQLPVELAAGEEVFDVSCVSMGNPHCVIEGNAQFLSRVREIGPVIEHHSWFPSRTNVELVEVHSPHHITIAVWERGAGITQACGTGACGTVVALGRRGRVSGRVRVSLPGGDVFVSWDRDRGTVFLEGPTACICHGILLALSV